MTAKQYGLGGYGRGTRLNFSVTTNRPGGNFRFDDNSALTQSPGILKTNEWFPSLDLPGKYFRNKTLQDNYEFERELTSAEIDSHKRYFAANAKKGFTTLTTLQHDGPVEETASASRSPNTASRGNESLSPEFRAMLANLFRRCVFLLPTTTKAHFCNSLNRLHETCALRLTESTVIDDVVATVVRGIRKSMMQEMEDKLWKEDHQ